MASTQDTEITLGTGKLLVLFFGLVAICALFFALGYSLGRKSEPSLSTASAAVAPQTKGASKSSGATTTPSMTFYKSVEQKDANPELTPAADAKSDAPPTTPPAQTSATSSAATSTGTPADNAPDPTVLPSTAAYFVQVAAVTKKEDADSLVDALKKKQYPAFVADAQADKLFRVQLGPFSDVKDAETMRSRLIADGYSPILKR